MILWGRGSSHGGTGGLPVGPAGRWRDGAKNGGRQQSLWRFRILATWRQIVMDDGGKRRLNSRTMEAKHVIDHIRSEINKASKSGIQFIQVSALLTFLSELERNAPVATEAVKFQHEAELAFRRSQHEANSEMFRSVIDSGKTALTTCILINGGATIALLAFIGNVYSKSQSGVSVPRGITTALATFSFAVLLAALATSLTYFTQVSFHRNCPKRGNTFNTISILFVLSAYILFVVGVLSAYHAFVSMP